MRGKPSHNGGSAKTRANPCVLRDATSNAQSLVNNICNWEPGWI